MPTSPPAVLNEYLVGQFYAKTQFHNLHKAASPCSCLEKIRKIVAIEGDQYVTVPYLGADTKRKTKMKPSTLATQYRAVRRSGGAFVFADE